MIIRLTPVYQEMPWWKKWKKKYLIGYKFQKFVNGVWEDYDE